MKHDMLRKTHTPFPVTGYFGPEYFCDREDELGQLLRNLRGGHSTSLISLRRMGKTALIRHLFHQIKSDYTTIYLDILPTESINDLLNRFSTAIISEYSEKSPPGKKIWQMIRSLRPVLSYDSLSGAPVVSIRATPDESKKSIGELFSFLEKMSDPVVIAIDEFQQIMEYPEKQTDAWLRSLVQHLKNVQFIFAGSQQHVMTELFTHPGRPFFRSTQFMKMGRIREATYRQFIIEKFREHSRSISAETVTGMLNWADLHTYYVQLLCNRVFLTARKNITPDVWKQEAARILKEQEFVFYAYRDMLTKPQWELLKAIAREGKVYHPTASEFISGNSLGNPSTVLRSLHSLLKMELIYRESDEEGHSYYGIYDVLFGRWI